MVIKTHWKGIPLKSIKGLFSSRTFKVILFSWLVALLGALTITPFFPHSEDYAFLNTPHPPPVQQAYALFSALINDHPVKLDETTNIDKISSPFVILSIKARSVEENLSSKAYGMIDAYLGEIEASQNPYFVNRSRDLRLMSDYFAGRYDNFINTAAKHPSLPKNLIAPLVAAHLVLKKAAEAQTLFDQYFSSMSINSWSSVLTPAQLTALVRNLPAATWNSQLDILVQQEQYTTLSTLLRLRPAPERSQLLEALRYYSNKEYQRAAQQIDRIKTPNLEPWKEYLRIKIDARLDRQEALSAASKQFRHNKIHYLNLLSDLGGILIARDQDELGLEFYSRYLSEVESIVETQPIHPFEQLAHLLPLVPHEELYWQILYRAAWINHKLDRRPEFRALMQKCIEAPIHSIRQSAMVWTIDDRQELLSRLSPFGYEFARQNGALTRQHLEPFLHKIAGPMPWSPAEQNQLTDLFHYSLFDDALDYCQWLRERYPDHQAGRKTLAVCEAIIQSKQDNQPQAFFAFKKEFTDYSSYILPRYLGFMVLPLPHEALIKEEAGKNNLDPLLVTSLIRQESFFRANAVSPSDAHGLMQLLPRTAQEVNPFTARITTLDLQKPHINVRLGCLYLKKLMDRYQNKTHLALAAYNAGPERVDGWISQLGPIQPDEFIELIPFSETRLYVKNIIRNMYYYKYYYPEVFPARN